MRNQKHCNSGDGSCTSGVRYANIQRGHGTYMKAVKAREDNRNKYPAQ